MNLQEAKSFLEQNDVRYVLAQFVDIHGVAKTKAVPVEHFDDRADRRRRLRRLRRVGPRAWGRTTPTTWRSAISRRCRSCRGMPGYARIVCDGHVRGKPWPLRYARRPEAADSNASSERGWTLYTGLEPEFMLLARGPTAALGPADATRRPRQAVLRLQGPVARQRSFSETLIETARAGRHRRLPDRPRGRQRPVRDQLHLLRLRSTSADHFVFFKMAAGEIARKLGMICTLHAEAVLEPHRQRHAHPHLAWATRKRKNLFTDENDQARARPVGPGLPLPRRPARACAAR